MRFRIYQADAFTSQLFGGNPAALVPLESWLPSETMQNIAAENNLAETAFIVPTGGATDFHLRWFTPSTEVRLCGHATLATAHLLWTELGFEGDKLRFDSLSGVLKVRKNADQYTLDFPADILRGASSDEADAIHKVLGVNLLETFRGNDDFMAVLPTQADIETLAPDFKLLKTLNSRGLIVTAKGDEVDFVSRCFFPEAGIEEDPVTGSAHTTMTPFWSEKLEKSALSARQLSARGGELHCVLAGDRVEISGAAVTYLVGEIRI